jgi:thiol:disulfide interchange protein
MSKNWEDELKKIDRQLESISDEALLPAKNAPTAAAKVEAVQKQASTNTLGVMLRLVLAVGLGVGIAFWPYGTRCGLPLLGYLASTGMVIAAGTWTALWTWRHRSGRAHFLSLLLVAWGAGLAAREILPRVGYATPTLERPATWLCQ